MSTPVRPKSSSPSGDEINVTPGTEEQLHQFWQRNRNLIVALCAVVLLVIVGRGGWDYLAEQKSLSREKNFAAAQTSDQLKAFAAANAGHNLAGVAWLRVADEAYAAHKGADAVNAYQKAAGELAQGPLAERASLGLAMAQLQAGQSTEGVASLQKIADSPAVSSGLRVEAAYQLASLAYTANNAADVKKFSDLILRIDPSSPWAQRAMTLRSPDQNVATASVAAPTETTGSADSVIKLNLPGK